MRSSLIIRLTVFTLALATLAPRPVKADDVYGRIRGTVTDPSGAVIGGAKVTATNVDTGISRSVQSGSDGSYEFLQLTAPATYKVTVSQTGFSTFEAQNIRLALDQIYVLNLTLQVGTVNQRITVEAAPAQVETTSMELGATLKSNTVVDLPLNGRNWVQLQATLPSNNSDTCNASFTFYGCPDRPNVVAPPVILNPRTGTAGTPPNVVGNVYFSPASFVAQSPGMLGNSGRNFFHGPGINNFDFALFKDTRVTESKMLELRFEFFNLFNHTQFNPVEQVNGVIGDANAPNFGAVLGALSSRVIQLGAKFSF